MTRELWQRVILGKSNRISFKPVQLFYLPLLRLIPTSLCPLISTALARARLEAFHCQYHTDPLTPSAGFQTTPPGHRRTGTKIQEVSPLKTKSDGNIGKTKSDASVINFLPFLLYIPCFLRCISSFSFHALSLSLSLSLLFLFLLVT